MGLESLRAHRAEERLVRERRHMSLGHTAHATGRAARPGCRCTKGYTRLAPSRRRAILCRTTPLRLRHRLRHGLIAIFRDDICHSGRDPAG